MRIVFIGIFLFVGLNIYGQDIKYQKSYKEALALAAQTNKPLFVTLMPPVFNVKGMPQFKSALETKEIADIYNKNFISVQAVVTDSAVNDLTGKLHPTIFPYYVFLDSRGGIVFKAAGNTNFALKFEDMASQAMARISSGNTLTHYDQLDKAGMITREQLKDYITLRESLDIFNNADLINKYVNLLAIKDLDNYNEILFILQAGPYGNSKAYKLAYTNGNLIDSIFKSEPLEIRVALNNHIISNTRNEAIRTKNAAMAQTAANFAAQTWRNNYQEANKSSTKEMLLYYKGVKDTTNYYMRAGNFYDNYYLNITTDSARRLQLEEYNKIRAVAQANNPNQAVKMPDIIASMIQLSPAKSLEVANELNNAAYDFYLMGTHNTTHLTKALIWSRRSIQLRPEAGYYDTMAHVMYRLNFYDEALLNQNKAIELAAQQPGPPDRVERLKGELNKMKTRQL